MKLNKVAKPIGARKLTWFPLVEDPDSGVASYGSPVKLSRLIDIQITPIFAEGELQSEDGMEEDVSLVVGYDVSITASQLTDGIRAPLLGHGIDAGDGVLTNYTDMAEEGALAWEELLSKVNKTDPDRYKKVILYKGKFKEYMEKAGTVPQSGSLVYQTHGLTARFRKRNDGHIKYSMREDSTNANATKLAAWFDAPQEYGDTYGTTVATPAASPVAGAVASGADVALSTATSGAVIRYTLDGSTPNATSTLYDGPIDINVALTIKAMAFKAGMNPSLILSAAYTISGG